MIDEITKYYKHKFFNLICEDAQESVQQREFRLRQQEKQKQDAEIQRQQQERDVEHGRGHGKRAQDQDAQKQSEFRLQQEKQKQDAESGRAYRGRELELQRDAARRAEESETAYRGRELELRQSRTAQQNDELERAKIDAVNNARGETTSTRPTSQSQTSTGTDQQWRAGIEDEIKREEAARLGRLGDNKDTSSGFRFIDMKKTPEITSNVRHTAELYGTDPYDLATGDQFKRQQEIYNNASPENQALIRQMSGDPTKPGYLDAPIVVNTGIVSAPKGHALSNTPGMKVGGFASSASRDKDGNDIAAGVYLNQNSANNKNLLTHEITHTRQDFTNHDPNVPYTEQPIEQGADAVAHIKGTRSTLPNGAIDRPLTDDELDKSLSDVDNRKYSTELIRNNPELKNYYRNMVADKSNGKKASPNVNNNDAFA